MCVLTKNGTYGLTEKPLSNATEIRSTQPETNFLSSPLLSHRQIPFGHGSVAKVLRIGHKALGQHLTRSAQIADGSHSVKLELQDFLAERAP